MVKKRTGNGQGWVCPVCGAGLSPYMSFCPLCTRFQGQCGEIKGGAGEEEKEASFPLTQEILEEYLNGGKEEVG